MANPIKVIKKASKVITAGKAKSIAREKKYGTASYKAAMSFGDSFSLLNNIQIGSKMIF